MSLPIQLLSTDFDGTILDWGLDVESAQPFFDLVGDWQKRGLIWAINTGRSIPQLEDALTAPNFPIQPNYIITTERAVHRRGVNSWEDFGDWNRRCAEAHARLHMEAREIYSQLSTYASRQRGMMLQRTDNDIEGIIALNESQMDEAVAWLEKLRVNLPDVNWQRNSVYLRFCHVDYDKGSALLELARLLGISREGTFAAGDNHNDLPMLDGSAARWVACPSNSIPEVKATVKTAGGHIASQIAGLGVAEALQACPWV
ncbi:MAG: HAD hydrolase family protein [Chthoniobacterales bacterium]